MTHALHPTPARPAAHAGRVHAALQRAGVPSFAAGACLLAWVMGVLLLCGGCEPFAEFRFGMEEQDGTNDTHAIDATGKIEAGV